jgi:hypothetical protein
LGREDAREGSAAARNRENRKATGYVRRAGFLTT